MVKPSSSKSKRNGGERGKEYPINGGHGRYKGVRMRKWGKWVAEMRLPNCRDKVWLGSYDTPEKAARAYDAAAFCIRGASAQLNFHSPPPHSSAQHDHQLTTGEIQALASRYAHEADDSNRIEKELKGGDAHHHQQEQEQEVICFEEARSYSTNDDMLFFDSLSLDGFLPNWEEE